MGTVTNINGGDGTGTTDNNIDEDKTAVVSVRVIAMLMAMAAAKAQDMTRTPGIEFMVANYKHQLSTASEAMDNAELFHEQFKGLCEEIQ